MNVNTVSQNALSILSAASKQEVMSATIRISVFIYSIRLLKMKDFTQNWQNNLTTCCHSLFTTIHFKHSHCVQTAHFLYTWNK